MSFRRYIIELRVHNRDIGHFDELCAGQPAAEDVYSRPSPPVSNSPIRFSPSPTPSPDHTQNNQILSRQTPSPAFPVLHPQLQGFVPLDNSRRQSPDISANTMTTTNDFNPQPNGRPYHTAPAGRQILAPANRGPVPRLSRSGTDRSYDAPADPPLSTNGSDTAHELQSSNMSHEDKTKRYSTGTSGTFGRWDAGLQSASGQEETQSPSNERNTVGGYCSVRRQLTCLGDAKPSSLGSSGGREPEHTQTSCISYGLFSCHCLLQNCFIPKPNFGLGVC